jgi:hypothetical protein
MKIALSPENKNETTVAFVTFHSLTNWNGDFLKKSKFGPCMLFFMYN